MYGLRLPDWYSKEEYLIIDVDILEDYIHFLCAKREDGVRFSLGCVKKENVKFYNQP